MSGRDLSLLSPTPAHPSCSRFRPLHKTPLFIFHLSFILLDYFTRQLHSISLNSNRWRGAIRPSCHGLSGDAANPQGAQLAAEVVRTLQHRHRSRVRIFGHPLGRNRRRENQQGTSRISKQVSGVGQ